MADIFIGVDVAKDWIDVFEPGCGATRIDSTPSDLRAFARRLARRKVKQVVFEASGGYDTPLRDALEAAGVRFSRVNPARARNFARCIGMLGKTDRTDAKMLSEMGSRLSLPDTEPLSPARRALKAQAARRRQLVDMRQGERTREKQVGDPGIRRSIARLIKVFTKEIEKVEAQMQSVIDADIELSALDRRLQTAPGVGPVVAITLLAEMSELGTLCRRRIAALAGLAPVARDSGKRSPNRSIGGGRPIIRSALYLAGLQASRFNACFKEFRDRLEANGKTPKQAIIATARKLLTTLNAMIRDQKDFNTHA